MKRVTANFLADTSEIPEFLNWLTDVLGSGQPISIDTETRSLLTLWVPRTPDPLAPGLGYCRLWQVGTATEGWALDATRWHGVINEAMHRIVGATNQVAFANNKFDQHVMEREGWPIIPWHRVHDVVVMHRLSRYYEQFHGLKPMAEQEFGAHAQAGQQRLNDVKSVNSWDWDTIPVDTPEYWQYGVMDTCLTVQMADILVPEQTWWYDVEMEFSRMAYNMERNGVLIHRPNLAKAIVQWEQDVADSKEALAQLGIDRPGSSKAVVEVMSSLGFKPTTFSDKTGDPVLDKIVLQTLQELGGPLAEQATHLMEYRRATKWLSTYGKGINKALYPGSDRINPTINTMGARTGRVTIAKPGPALQTIPAAKVTRSIFTVGRGRTIHAVDYSSQEVRIMAALSGDPAMVEFFNQGPGDYHQYVADLASIPRPVAKVVTYSRAYGAGVATMAQGAGVSPTDMQGYLDRIDAAFPEAMKWKDRVTREAEEQDNPHVVLPYGRKVRLEPGTEHTTAANTMIQGHGADVAKLAATRVSQAGMGDLVMLLMHDEFVLDTPETAGPHLAQAVAGYMVDDLLEVPLTVDIDGPLQTWGDKYE